LNDTELALTGLGFSAKDARRATASAANSLESGAALEEVIRAALRVLVPPGCSGRSIV
jgi:Holliday junction resolvasome RuvABC DNA-binding subunit